MPSYVVKLQRTVSDIKTYTGTFEAESAEDAMTMATEEAIENPDDWNKIPDYTGDCEVVKCELIS